MNSDALATGAAFAAALAAVRFGAVALFGVAAALVFLVPSLVLLFVLFFALILRTPLPGRMDVSSPCRSTAGKACARPCTEPVSYTHLRAHETRHDLVC